MERHLVDTNVLLRFFTGEPPQMAEKARRLVKSAGEGEVNLIVLPLVLAEVVFTLESFYKMERRNIATVLSSFLRCRGIEPTEPDRIFAALDLYANQRAHFTDAYLAASAIELRFPVSSFDRDFDRFSGVKRIEPKIQDTSGK